MKNTEWIKKGYFSHRGLHNKKFPENTIGAFKNSIINGYDIEFDILITKDNKLVISHDDNLLRLCGKDIFITKSNYDDIKDLTILDSNEKIPLLKELLISLPKETKLMIELKTNKKYKKMIHILFDIMKDFNFTYLLQSFDPRIVFQIKKINKDIIRGYIRKKAPTKFKVINLIYDILPINFIIKPDFIIYKFEDLPNKKMDLYKKRGNIVLSYTVRNEEELKFIKDRYDNAVFEGFMPKVKE